MKFFSKYKNKIIIGIIIIVAILIGKNIYQAQKYKNPTFFNPQKDTVITPKIQNIQDNLTLAGSVKADENATLTFLNPGKLVWVGVKVGDSVKKGQAIASQDKAQLQKSLQSQFNNYQTNLSQFWDVQNQYKDTVISDTVQRILDRTQYSLDNSVINYEIADMAVQESTLVSPINGVVTDVSEPHAGTNVNAANASFTIINPQSIYFYAEIDQSEVSQIKIGQKATLSIDAFPDTNLDSEITYIAFTPVAGQSSTVYELRFKLPVDNKNLTYRYGMDGDVTITLNQQDNALTLPIDALNDEGNGNNYVWVKNGDKLIKKNVTTGIENDTDVQILTGLNSNDSIVIKKV
jgi:macrolide-specific efflux system membrane fusion protein